MPAATTRVVELFVATVETGNFTRAAARLGITPAAVSRAIGRHERALGVQLFRRTTRRMQLTDAGARYFEHCRRALSLIEDAERELTHRSAAPHGLVRLSVPTTYGHPRVLPVLARLRAAYPDLELEIDVSNRNVDFVTEGYDLAVRAGPLPDSELIAHKLEDATLGVFASPAYLEQRGVPMTPEDLSTHSLIGFVRPSTGRILRWRLVRADGAAVSITPAGDLRCSDDFLACVNLARHGAGLVQAFHFLVEGDIERGDLVEVLAEFGGAARAFTLLQPPGHTLSAAGRLVVDALVADARARQRLL